MVHPIFQDENGMAIKFFIQKDIPQEIQTEVCETVVALGGRIEAKVPRAGYILVQPGTSEEERLRLCWTTPDRPERYFVPYTYVEACKIQGLLLKQIFIVNGHPIRMHIDSSIANVNVRATLSSRIMHSGGDPTASAQSAKVILADPSTEIFQHLVKTYQGQSDKYVESYLWVKKCIEKGQVSYTPVVYKNPGGRRPGEERTQFSDADEDHLCEWIAAKIPYKEIGGRTGNRLYQQLCELVNNPEYAWASRHTWQSWRERYKKNAARLDRKIAEVVQRKQPPHGEKGQYGYVRMPEEKPKRGRKKRHSDNENNIAGPSSQDMDNFQIPVPIPGMTTVLNVVEGTDGTYTGMFYAHAPPPSFSQVSCDRSLDVAVARQNATEEEMEDDESEWQIREGNAPPPPWAKRKAEDQLDESTKRQRISGSPPSAPSHLHVLDKAILEIACEYRFTIEEVREFYDKCGDMERTRARFQRFRQVLMSLNEEDAPPAPSMDNLQVES